MEQHHEQHNGGHEHHAMTESEINITVSYKNDLLSIHLEDKEGNAPELDITHEELIHLIVVSEDLNEYFHLHPIQINDYIFEKKIDLTGHSYRAFVDINPKGKSYVIEPIPFKVDSVSHIHYNDVHPFLQIDRELKKEVRGKMVEFKHDPFQVGKDIKLTFNIDNAMPEPYLGALGHVVIIDNEVQEFIHVHPISDKETVFVAHFSKPGIYKLWAEFKFDGEVINFPYVIEVK
ncbi:hypothetical protein JMM81_21465 [Bacillus sp. V3B]|uniref:hypothetical protein n=1 Tax=Bacillus sp. V3B TaxID=2804915 RepID=UPI00210BD4FD|nr:hypothetical protein [Bacillus sp. V3B]MCQ6277437.1 hypothetical protein [Bacillus sp. V3B]